jgi:hypothetical protein
MQHRRRQDLVVDPGGGGEVTLAGVDLPQGFSDESPPRKVKVERPPSYRNRGAPTEQQQQLTSSGGSGWILQFVFLMSIVLVASYFLVAHHEQIQLEHLRQDILHDEIEPLSKEWEEKLEGLQEENDRLKKEAKQYSQLAKENVQLQEEQHQQRKLRDNQDQQIVQLTKYKKKMQENIQHMSKTTLLEK